MNSWTNTTMNEMLITLLSIHRVGRSKRKWLSPHCQNTNGGFLFCLWLNFNYDLCDHQSSVWLARKRGWSSWKNTDSHSLSDPTRCDAKMHLKLFGPKRLLHVFNEKFILLEYLFFVRKTKSSQLSTVKNEALIFLLYVLSSKFQVNYAAYIQILQNQSAGEESP